jgi:NADH-quinone oxidoreductase subunit L
MFRLIIITFHGEPRNKEKYEHARESRFVMVMPLVVLSVLSIFIWYTPNPFNPDKGWFYGEWIKNPVIHTPESSRFDFMRTDTEQSAEAGQEIMYSETYTEAVHHSHSISVVLSLLMDAIAIFLAFMIYQWRKISADKIAERVKPLYNFSYNKWYFDELYHMTFVAGTIGFSRLIAWFDLKVIDGIVDGSAAITKAFSSFVGKFDDVVIDGLVNLTATISGIIGLLFRRLQTGKVQTYIIMVIFSIVILLFLFKSI